MSASSNVGPTRSSEPTRSTQRGCDQRYGAKMTARRPRELRLALSMNGGVSLAVWIGGAVSEIDCLRSGKGFWGELLDHCGFQPKALVDVMTGASAGGLNAVLMAQAIRSGTPFSEFLKLWEDHADIDKLLKGPLTRVTVRRARGVEGRLLRRRVEKGVGAARRTSARAEPCGVRQRHPGTAQPGRVQGCPRRARSSRRAAIRTSTSRDAGRRREASMRSSRRTW